MRPVADPATLSLSTLSSALPEEWTPSVTREAVRYWQSLGALWLDNDTGNIQLREPLPPIAPSQGPDEALVWAPLTPPPDHGGGRQVALLSLFAGMGTDRIALERILAERGLQDRLGPSWFAESDDVLRTAVERVWE